MSDNNIESPHIGELLKKYAAEKRIYRSGWARYQKVRDSTVLRYFKKPSMQTSTLFIISQVLKYNFFRHIADLLPPDYPPGGSMQTQIDALKKENEKLKDENALLKEMVMKKN